MACSVLCEKRELIHVVGLPLLSGWFGVEKDDCPPHSHPTYLDQLVLRSIMNLAATNILCRQFPVDIASLPYLGQWRAIALLECQVLFLSVGDLKSSFNQTKLPDGRPCSPSRSTLRFQIWGRVKSLMMTGFELGQ